MTTIEETQRSLIDRLQDVGVIVHPRGAVPGPTITRFDLELAHKVTVNKIQARTADLSYALGVPVRVVETGDPYRLAVEVPRRKHERERVRLSRVIDAMQGAPATTIPLGITASGEVKTADLAELPHLLVGGRTGAGKSMALRSILSTWAIRTMPAELNLVLIDPKRVEFRAFRHLPHLALPVVTDDRQALEVLESTLREADKRYAVLEGADCRDIRELNAKRPGSMIPLVVVVDETADLFMAGGDSGVKETLIRIAQKGRAAGVHLILATQRPSFEVFPTGLRANVPARLALSAGMKRDSMTIIDCSDAAGLLGEGDALFREPGALTRVQLPYVESVEVDAVMTKWTTFKDRLATARRLLGDGKLNLAILQAEGMTGAEAEQVLRHMLNAREIKRPAQTDRQERDL